MGYGVCKILGSVVAARGLSRSATCGVLVPWSGIEPVSSTLQDRFLTTGPWGKTSTTFLFPNIPLALLHWWSPLANLSSHKYLCVLSSSIVSGFFVTPWTVALQALLSIDSSWQEYWSGLSFPSPHKYLLIGKSFIHKPIREKNHPIKKKTLKYLLSWPLLSNLFTEK